MLRGYQGSYHSTCARAHEREGVQPFLWFYVSGCAVNMQRERRTLSRSERKSSAQLRTNQSGSPTRRNAPQARPSGAPAAAKRPTE
jgi:hypothetical protein